MLFESLMRNSLYNAHGMPIFIFTSVKILFFFIHSNTDFELIVSYLFPGIYR